MKSALFAAIATLALCGAAIPARAAPVTFTFSGSLVSGVDHADLFGLGSGSLAGQSYKVVETFSDLAPFLLVPTLFNSGGSIDVAVTVGSGTATWTLDQMALVSFVPGTSVGTQIIPAPVPLALNIGATSADVGPTLASFSAGPSNASIGGTLNYSLPASPSMFTSLTFGNAVSAVPLPPALPMMGSALLGLGAVGYGLKRNRRRAAADLADAAS